MFCACKEQTIRNIYCSFWLYNATFWDAVSTIFLRLSTVSCPSSRVEDPSHDMRRTSTRHSVEGTIFCLCLSEEDPAPQTQGQQIQKNLPTDVVGNSARERVA